MDIDGQRVSPDDGTLERDDTSTSVVGDLLSEQEGVASTIWYPVFDSFEKSRSIVAALAMTVRWDSFIDMALLHDSDDIYIVFSNDCGDVFTLEITGSQVIYHREKDAHDERYDDYRFQHDLTNPGVSPTGVELNTDYCKVTIDVYPTSEALNSDDTSMTLVYALVLGSLLTITVAIFCVYDILMRRRQIELIEAAVRSNAIVSSMFPEVVRDRLFQNGTGDSNDQQHHQTGFRRLPSAIGASRTSTVHTNDRSAPPIADLFTAATVMFGDISGFTAWSSSREPGQVFMLLETLYGAFDSLAKKMHVFKVRVFLCVARFCSSVKTTCNIVSHNIFFVSFFPMNQTQVETVGDCYVGKKLFCTSNTVQNVR